MISRREFDREVARVMRNLPPAFEPYLDNLVVDVEDEADAATLRALDFTEEEIADGATIYGLFIPSPYDGGDGLQGVDGHDQPPHRIVIYRRPLAEDFPDPDQLRVEIRKTVVHELAHHFGWTDRDLEDFDDHPNPFER
jgi:predicted Zn-dependent protease with MMP-like domain